MGLQEVHTMSAETGGTFGGVIERIVRAYDVLSKTINPAPMLKLDLTSAQIKVLMSFEAQSSYTMTDLSRENAVTVSTMTSMVERLVLFGLLTRRYDEHDRRRVLACVTEKGRKVIAHIMNIRRRELERFLGGLREPEIAEFVDSIEKTAHFLNKAKQTLKT
jgi:MarR family transcriptional regulator, organic hydroperoxide resistance regulator